MHKIFLSTMENPDIKHRLTLAELLSNPGDIREQVTALDYAMSSMVAQLRHEPAQLTETVESYESLYLLRKAIKNIKPA